MLTFSCLADVDYGVEHQVQLSGLSEEDIAKQVTSKYLLYVVSRVPAAQTVYILRAHLYVTSAPRS